MECRNLGEGRVKISLSAEELEEWHTSPQSFTCTDEDGRRILRTILQRAGEKLGRKGGPRMEVKLFGKPDGGCDLYVTGWEERHSQGDLCGFLFDSLDDWLCLYQLLSKEEKGRWQHATALPSGRWIAYRTGEEEDFFSEFSSPLPGEYLHSYLSEHFDEL